MKPSNRIFTLIELLIVIAIIAILAAMLLPALRKAMARAHSVGCLNNLKTISSACNFYSMDYNDWIIPSGAQINKAWCYNLAYGFRSPVTAKGNPYGLKYDGDYSGGYIYPTPGNAFDCPGNPTPFGANGYAATQYGINYFLSGFPSSGSYYAKISAATTPSRAFLAGDSNLRINAPWRINWTSFFAFIHGGTPGYNVYPPAAAAGANVVYIDGHAGLKTYGQMSSAPAVKVGGSDLQAEQRTFLEGVNPAAIIKY